MSGWAKILKRNKAMPENLSTRATLLERLKNPADQAAWGLVAMAHYDDPAVARSLGFDPEAVAARGRALRRAEGRP